MTTAIRILVIILALLGFMQWQGWDGYHGVAGGISLLVSLSLVAALVIRSAKENEELVESDPEMASLIGDSFVASLLKGLFFGVIALLLAWFSAVLMQRTPVYGLFYNVNYEQLVSDLQVSEEDGNFQAAIDRIDRAYNLPMSEEKRVALAQRKFNNLIRLGDKATSVEAGQLYYVQAEVWAKKAKLSENDIALANAKIRALQPTPSAMPTLTPMPTYTPYPTPKPLPTWTPVPTSTPDRERPPLDLSRCQEVYVINRLNVGGVFQSWDCGDWGWYGQWRPTKQQNAVGGLLPQPYVADGPFYLCPPPAEAEVPYTAKSCN